MAEKLPTAAETRCALEVARELGHRISGYEMAAGKTVRVFFAANAPDDADVELEKWMRGRRGAG